MPEHWYGDFAARQGGREAGRPWRRLDPITRHWLIVTGGSLARLALGLIPSVLVARALGPSQLAVLAALGAFAAISGGVVEFGLTQAVVRRIAPRWPHDAELVARRAATFVSLRVASAALALLLVLLLGLTMGRRAWTIVDDHPVLFALALLGAAGTAFSGSMAGIFQGLQQFGRLNMVLLTNSGLTMLLAAGLFVSGQLNLYTAIVVLGIGTTIASFIVGFRLLPPVVRGRIPARIDREEASALFRTGRWVWLSGVLALLGAQLDLVLASQWLPAASAGAYALALSLATKADVVNQSLYATVLPVAAQITRPADFVPYLRRSLTRSAAIAVCLLPLFVFAEPLISAIYGEAFRESAHLFRLLLAVVLIDVFVTPVILLAFSSAEPRVVPVVDGARVVGLVVSAALLIPLLGASGAVGARAVSRLLGLLVIAVWIVGRLRGRHATDASPELAPDVQERG